LITAKPPAESPYSVEYPVASSLLLPVVSTIQPRALDTAIRTTPRIRDCRFSSVRPVGSAPSASARTEVKAACTFSMGTLRMSMPRCSANEVASVTDPALE